MNTADTSVYLGRNSKSWHVYLTRLLPNCLSTSARFVIVDGFLVWVQKISVIKNRSPEERNRTFLKPTWVGFGRLLIEVIAAVEFDPWWRDGHAVPKRREPITQWHGVIIRNCAAAEVRKFNILSWLRLPLGKSFSTHHNDQSHLIEHSLTYSFDTAIRRSSEQTEHNS
jgi:hypothetical protein